MDGDMKFDKEGLSSYFPILIRKFITHPKGKGSDRY